MTDKQIMSITAGPSPDGQDGVVVSFIHPQGGVLTYTGKAVHINIEPHDPKPRTPRTPEIE